MEIIRIPRIMQDTSRGHRLHGRTIGFVPTMGALHEGHLSLVRMAREENDISVVSIYVNPTQFGPLEDFAKYPRDFERDTEKIRKEEVDILFLPDDASMYPAGFSTSVEVRAFAEKLCGAFRPGHFRGVATVVAKLLNIVGPTRAYFGRKDFQQSVVIKRMVKDLDLTADIVVCPTVREEDGLAMSSRNRYLSRDQRKAAGSLFESLSRGSDAIQAGMTNAASVRDSMTATLRSEPLVAAIQYCSVYDPETLEELEEIEGEVLLALAVKIGETRLIDNMLVTPGRGSADRPESRSRCSPG